MKSLFHLLSKALLVSLCFIINTSLFSQAGRYPTQAEIDLKKQLEQRYLSNSNRSAIPTHLLTTGPEQNCMNAITVCQQSYTQSNSYTGPGSIQEVSGTCLMIQESNSVWYVFTAQNAGTFTFMLNTPNDYDFALYDITNTGCAGVPTAIPIRCNYSATYGSTGLVLPATAGNISYAANQPPTMDAINVTAGQTFALIIDNFSANANGYTLTFGGTAQIFDNNPPLFNVANSICGTGNVNVDFSEFIACSSISANGSDFTITGPGSISVPITAISTGACLGGASTTNSIGVSFNNAGLPSGIYTITVGAGSDGNTVLDQCANSMLAAQSVTFAYLSSLSISATNTMVCVGGSSTLSVTTAGNPSGIVYNWAPVTNSTDNLTVSPTTNITYIVTATYGGCSTSVSQQVVVGFPPVVTVNPANISLCSGTANLTAFSTMGGNACTNCNYTWSGSSTQVDNNVASSTVTGAGAGSYTVTVSSDNGCIGNSAVSNVSIISPSTPPSCNIIYASPAGGGTGLIPTSPTDIQTALTMAACNNVVIKMEIGDYTINNPLNVGAFTTIEGGFDIGFPTKTSSKGTSGGFPLQGTRIIRSTANVEGGLGTLRYTGINITPSSSFFRLQDLRVDMPDNASGSGISNYGIYLGSGCNNYNITRCYVYSGNAGSGTNGTPAGAAGAVGAIGSVGSNGAGVYVSPVGNSGAGGNGGGAGFGTGGPIKIGGAFGVGLVGNNGTVNTNPQAGKGGASGGTGGRGNSTCAAGGVGGVGFSGGTGGAAGPGSCSNSTSGCGFSAMTGGIGANGTSGAVGTVGPTGTGSDASGYWTLANGGNGTSGLGGNGGGGGGGGGNGFNAANPNGCGTSYPIGTSGVGYSYGTGGGGGGGGGGGQGGFAGVGGTGGGSTYGIFIFNNGASGVVADCQIVNGLPGAGGAGSSGGPGGAGGAGGVGGAAGAHWGAGGTGGNGGAGGAGGAGGNGCTGVAVPVQLIGGSALALNTSKNMITESLITVDNKACTGVSMAHATSVGSPVWSNFDSGSLPSSGSGSPVSTTYSTLGHKTLVMNTDTYTDFNNIIVNPPATGNILASSSNICPGTVNFVSSALGTAGFNYSWSASPAGATILTPNIGSTLINFTNTTGSPITFTITLTINSNCCGLMAPVETTIVVNPSSGDALGLVNNSCLGGIATFSATSPTGSSFSWYSNSTGTTLLGAGDNYTISNVSTPATVYLQATNAYGCTSTLTPVAMTPSTIPAPTAIPSFSLSCDPGLVQVGINPVPGATSYSWYSDAGGTTLVQVGTALDYLQTISTAGGSYTVYVQTNIVGCLPSGLTAVSASVSTTPIFITSTITPNDTVCSNFPVNFDITASGGNGVFTYSWSPFSSTVSNPTYSFATSTSVYVDVSSNGCNKHFLIPMIIANLAPPPLTATINNMPCGGTVTTMDAASTSSNSISFTWYGPNPTSVLSGSNAAHATGGDIGTYTVIALDAANGCTNTVSGLVDFATPSPTLTNGVNGSGLGCDTGMVAVIVNSGGTGSIYTWYADAAGTVTLQSSTSSTYAQQIANYGGTYTVYVQATTPGCLTSSLTALTASLTPVPIVFTSNFNDIVCGGTTSTLTANSTNTLASFSYTWSGVNVLSGANTPTAEIGAIGGYSVIGTDAVTGCNNLQQGIVDFLTPTPVLTNGVGGSALGCDTGYVAMIVTSGGTGSIYTWYSDAAGTQTLQSGTSNTYAQQIANYGGTYTVYVQGATPGCLTSSLIALTASLTPVPVTFTASFANLPCVGTSTIITAASNSAGANFSYFWNGVSVIAGANTPTATVNAVGSYSVIGTDAVSGCNNAMLGNVNQGVISVGIVATPTTGVASLPVSFTDLSIGGSSFTWNFGDGNSSPTSITSINPSNTYVNAGTFTVTLIVTEGICEDTAYAVIVVDNTIDFSNFPHIITPNGDGKNDFLIIPNIEKFQNNLVQIYNRWGSLVYEKHWYQNNWDGTPNVPSMGKGLLPSATYFIVIDLGDGKTPPFHDYIDLKY